LLFWGSPLSGAPPPPLFEISGSATGGPVSQQVWHDKDPSLLKGSERRA
jgi:hypothetical protein